MPRPGVDVFVLDDPVQGEAILDPSQGFYAGFTERGRMGSVQTFSQYKDKYGGLTADTKDMYQAARAFFEESGGATLYVSPVSGVGAAEAFDDLGTFLHVVARGNGTWANDVTVASEAPTSMSEIAMGGVVYVVEQGGVQVERSPAYATIAEAIDWSQRRSNYVIFEPYTGVGATNVPVSGQVAALAGGVNGYVWSDIALAEALLQFPYELGPGQVYVPGHAADADTRAVAAHTLETFRVGMFDLADSADPNDLASQLGAVYDMPGARNMLAVGPKFSYPAETPPATIMLPSAGAFGGVVARVDKRGDPSLAATGVDGYSARALGLSQLYSDDDRAELNTLGASLWKNINGQLRMYGYRTAAGPSETNWLFWQESRVIMMIAHECNAVLEEYVLKTLTRKMLPRVDTAVSGVLGRYWTAGALFGVTSGQAFRVDVNGPNTDASMARGELYTNVMLKTSKLAEWVVLNLIKYRTERQFPAAAAA